MVNDYLNKQKFKTALDLKREDNEYLYDRLREEYNEYIKELNQEILITADFLYVLNKFINKYEESIINYHNPIFENKVREK